MGRWDAPLFVRRDCSARLYRLPTTPVPSNLLRKKPVNLVMVPTCRVSRDLFSQDGLVKIVITAASDTGGVHACIYHLHYRCSRRASREWDDRQGMCQTRHN